MATYMSASFVRRFTENRDATSITYNSFIGNSEDSGYPTFTICFEGPRLHWYQQLEIFNAFELSFEQFQRMLKGQDAIKYDYDSSSRLFKKVPTFVNNGSDVPFSEFHLRMTDILITATFTRLNVNLYTYFTRYL